MHILVNIIIFEKSFCHPQCSFVLTELIEDPENACNGAGSYRLSGVALYWQQFYTCLQKQFFQYKQNIKGLLIQIILPVLFISVAMTMGATARKVESEPSLVMSPVQYYNITPKRGLYIPYSHQYRYRGKRTVDAGPEGIIRTFTEPSGISATCVLKSSTSKLKDEDVKYLTKNNVTDYFNDECLSVFYPVESPITGKLIEPIVNLLDDIRGAIKKIWEGIWQGSNDQIKGMYYSTLSCMLFVQLALWQSWLGHGALINVYTPGCGTSVVRGPTGHK